MQQCQFVRPVSDTAFWLQVECGSSVRESSRIQVHAGSSTPRQAVRRNRHHVYKLATGKFRCKFWLQVGTFAEFDDKTCSWVHKPAQTRQATESEHEASIVNRRVAEDKAEAQCADRGHGCRSYY